MCDITQEDALRHAGVLVGQALKDMEARCAVLAQYVNDCQKNRSMTSALNEALRELHALHCRRAGLLRRRSLVQEALDCPVGESPTKAPLPPPPTQPGRRTQQQVQIRARRRS